MAYPYRKKPDGPEWHYHGTISYTSKGTSKKTGRPWFLYVADPDFAWADWASDATAGAAMAKKIKWFSDEPLKDPSGKEYRVGDPIFLSGNYKEYSFINPVGALLTKVKPLDEATFKSVTGYPNTKRQPEQPSPGQQQPAPSPLPAPPRPPAPTPGGKLPPVPKLPPPPGTQSKTAPATGAPQPCAAKVEELISKVEEGLARLREAKSKAYESLEELMPGAGKVLEEGAGRIERAKTALSLLEAQSMRRLYGPDSNDVAPAVKEGVSKLVPEVSWEADAKMSPKAFLEVAKVMMDHALATIDIVAEDPDGLSKADFGPVSASIGGKPVTLPPMFGPNEMSKGIDYIEQAFLNPMQDAISKAERAAAQEIPEFDHGLPFIPGTTKKERPVAEMRGLISQFVAKAKSDLDQATEGMKSLPEADDIEAMKNQYVADIHRLDLMRFECPSQRDRIDQWKKEKLALPQVQSLLAHSSTWISRNCRFAR